MPEPSLIKLYLYMGRNFDKETSSYTYTYAPVTGYREKEFLNDKGIQLDEPIHNKEKPGDCLLVVEEYERNAQNLMFLTALSYFGPSKEKARNRSLAKWFDGYAVAEMAVCKFPILEKLFPKLSKEHILMRKTLESLPKESRRAFLEGLFQDLL